MDNIGKNIGILCRQLNLYLNHSLENCGVTATEIMYLGSLLLKDGVSQEELAIKLNVVRQTVSKWELGQTTPEMDKLIEMSKLFGISLFACCIIDLLILTACHYKE